MNSLKDYLLPYGLELVPELIVAATTALSCYCFFSEASFLYSRSLSFKVDCFYSYNPSIFFYNGLVGDSNSSGKSMSRFKSLLNFVEI